MKSSARSHSVVWILALALAVAMASGARAQEAEEGGERPDNLRQPPGTETVPLGTLGHVERRGHGEVHLLLVPGAGFGWSVWEDFMNRNADRYTLWAVTPPGYDGTSPPPMPESVDVTNRVWSDALVKALATLIREELLRAPVVVGHHMLGDYYAMRLALEYPDLVSGLVVAAGMPAAPTYRTEDGERRPATEQERTETVREQLQPTMRHATREFFVQNQFPERFFSHDEERAKELYQQQIDNPVSTQVRYALEYYTSDLTRELGDLEVPMLVVQPLPWESFDDFIAVFEDNLRQMFGEDADLEESLLKRYGSWEAFREEQSGVERWSNDLTEAPEQLEIEVVRSSAQFVMHDRPEEFDRILAAWIERSVVDAVPVRAR